MIQIIACKCVQSKLRQSGVSFYKNQRFYEIEDGNWEQKCRKVMSLLNP